MKKKQIVLLLAVCAIGALTACSSSAGAAGKSSGSGETAAPAETVSEETAEETEKEETEDAAEEAEETVEEVVEEDPGPPRSALTGLEISQEEADADVRRCLHEGMDDGKNGFIFSTSNCVYTGLPLERYERMIDIWQKEGIYGKR